MSRQAKRSCCYRGCTVNNHQDPDRTLFQFPKDEERAKQWSTLGAVDVNIPGQKLMCDLHFSRIYMCFSARRKMLLNTAIPIAYGTELEEQDQEQEATGDAATEAPLPTSSSSQGETEEEHLDEYEMMDPENTHAATEVIYMEDLQEITPDREPVSLAPTTASPKARIIKVEKLPTLVTSSSGAAGTPVLASPQGNIILRKVKLKKRPSTVFSSPVSTKKLKPESVSPAEATVSSSPEKKIVSPKTFKKIQTVKVIPSPASSSSNAATVTPKTPTPAKAPTTPSKPLRVTLMEKRKECINEFIFKGEEYIQLPKESYLQDLDDFDQELLQLKAKHNEEVEELVHLLDTCKAESEQCLTEKELYKAENEKLAKKLEDYRMVIRNMRDVLSIFECDDDE